MDYAAAAKALMRRKLMERIYDKMTSDERRLFAQMTMQQRSTDDILAALQRQQSQLADLRSHQQTFAEDLTSNIIGNAAWDGLVWLARRLFRGL